ncbi:unnamed protein product [Closterium sp. NIES-64]|nr:unnamed protein product [Closterium sp. NIES-64]
MCYKRGDHPDKPEVVVPVSASQELTPAWLSQVVRLAGTPLPTSSSHSPESPQERINDSPLLMGSNSDLEPPKERITSTPLAKTGSSSSSSSGVQNVPSCSSKGQEVSFYSTEGEQFPGRAVRFAVVDQFGLMVILRMFDHVNISS